MKNLFLSGLLLLFIFSCNNDKSATQNQQPPEDSVLAPIQPPDDLKKPAKYISSFEKAFIDFQTVVFNEDAEGVNAFIDPERGLYIIENPGALPKMTLVKDIRNFKREFQGKSFFTIKDFLQTCELKAEPLPAFNCAGETPENNAGYSKEGCFVADAAEFRKTEIHKYASLPKAEVKNINATLPLVTKTVLQTAGSYRFHFGYINGKWRVLFIDLRIPCSA